MVIKGLGLLAAMLALSGGAAQAGDCNRVLEAGLKSLGVPRKTTTTTTGFNVMPKTAIVITAGGKRYAQRTNRGWTVSDWDAPWEQIEYRRNFGATDSGCDLAGSETIDGAAADMFDSRYVNSGGEKVNERIWISQASGLPVREEVHMGSGTFTVTMTTTMAYQDIQPPSGVAIRPGVDTVPFRDPLPGDDETSAPPPPDATQSSSQSRAH